MAPRQDVPHDPDPPHPPRTLLTLVVSDRLKAPCVVYEETIRGQPAYKPETELRRNQSGKFAKGCVWMMQLRIVPHPAQSW